MKSQDTFLSLQTVKMGSSMVVELSAFAIIFVHHSSQRERDKAHAEIYKCKDM